ncbi:hypothetical protein [Streptomyces sp. CAU 1734]|uniref:hypothetical protein n=1 Tax=Streptomyces sp. CAU 1734 TaxID=3140360 RepID=UPI0032619EA8
MKPRTDPATPERPQPPWTAGCLVLIAGGLTGYGAARLSQAARRACRVIPREFPGLFDWWTWETPLTVLAGAFTALAAWGIPAGIVRRRRGRLLIPATVLGCALTTLALWHMAWLGTPVGDSTMGSDGGGCAADHRPPWWPDPLPS